MTGPSKSIMFSGCAPNIAVEENNISASSYILCEIINWSLRKGVFPSTLKTADVTPIIKNTSLDRHILKNYRPVSNLAYTGKLNEKVVLNRLNEHMSEHGLGEPLQSTYRPRHSTETALVNVQHDITAQLDKGRGYALVLLDLISAPFDTIDPRGVTDTLQRHIAVALGWFKDYLTMRNQIISIRATVSEPARLS